MRLYQKSGGSECGMINKTERRPIYNCKFVCDAITAVPFLGVQRVGDRVYGDGSVITAGGQQELS